MKRTLFALCLSLTTAWLWAQQADFERYIIKHKDWKETATTQWDLELKSAKGNLVYLGAEHADEPSHQQFKKIKTQWEAFKPTLAFYEGPDRGIDVSDTATIRKFGESGYMRYLAKQSGIKVLSLEPSPVDLYQYLCSKYPQEQVDVYMLSKEAMRLRTRKELNKEQITVELNKMLGLFTKMLGQAPAVSSIEKLDEAFKKNFGNGIEWWQAPADWFDPQQTGSSAKITNQLAVLSTEYRDIYMVKVLVAQINKGERVFAVVGKNHVPLQAKALKYATGL